MLKPWGFTSGCISRKIFSDELSIQWPNDDGNMTSNTRPFQIQYITRLTSFNVSWTDGTCCHSIGLCNQWSTCDCVCVRVWTGLFRLENRRVMMTRWRSPCTPTSHACPCMCVDSFTHLGYILVGIFMGCLNTPLACKCNASLMIYHGGIHRDDINLPGDAGARVRRQLPSHYHTVTTTPSLQARPLHYPFC